MKRERNPVPPVTGPTMSLRQCAQAVGIGPRDLRTLMTLDCGPPYRMNGRRFEFDTEYIMRVWAKKQTAI
jgi:hypothetical protein